ncbi:ArsR family transcriptional regulator, virulence genes transcriptional regulator [Candidatus Hakubella thermalkaliphila]|uniref:ArsR family transcriptional regulator, virulence genes transcriptional regulator n=2 Tax=Candidatus Hakubella thermalkaliphila TaxID=2754717 RepID=A0A6V8Q6V3_9ACTN|nr:metalloregulator ArsR/SmtB family transcription factor [Candidatus Hakubella thermalkaliphila]GFP31103.1 ArsR family transcriptional regulator, virulence genes transcriptional regulator [Candidatus Hakubella thermalkaliphila]GFP40180.1 ArsR family transcriptional regulator, virulence genes transcriptional regulator [Candidatus Hakubella thermalkaliphila]
MVEEEIYSYHAEMCKVFSHPKRLELINVLRDREVSAGELCQILKMSPSNLSQHLAMMRDRRILVSRKEGNVVYYRVSNHRLLEAFDILREILFEQIRHDATLIPEEAAQEEV